MYRKQVRRRRAVLVGLIVLSLILLSSHFSEADSGPLHSIQRGVATIFSPVGEVAERALKPVRDLVNWFDETFDARGENEDLRAEVAQLREECQMPAQVTESPLTCVAVGSGRSLEEFEVMRKTSKARTRRR